MGKTNQVPLTVPLRHGEKVVIQGELWGVVQYIGHIESLDFPQIYVGVQLEAPGKKSLFLVYF